MSDLILTLNEMTQDHLILLMSSIFALAALVSLFAGSSSKRTEQALSTAIDCCFATQLEQWVPGYMQQHMIIVFCDFAGTPERRGRCPWLLCLPEDVCTRFFCLAKVSYPNTGG